MNNLVTEILLANKIASLLNSVRVLAATCALNAEVDGSLKFMCSSKIKCCTTWEDKQTISRWKLKKSLRTLSRGNFPRVSVKCKNSYVNQTVKNESVEICSIWRFRKNASKSLDSLEVPGFVVEIISMTYNVRACVQVALSLHKCGYTSFPFTPLLCKSTCTHNACLILH